MGDFVKQGTPRQSILLGKQNCNVSFGFNSAGKKNLLLGVPSTAADAVVFDLGTNQITVPPKSALRITLNSDNQIERMDGNPQGTVTFQAIQPVDPPAMASDQTENHGAGGLVFAETKSAYPTSPVMSESLPPAPNQLSPSPLENRRTAPRDGPPPR